jgi:cytochrome P450
MLLRSTEDKHTLLTKALAENEDGVGLSDEIIVKEGKAFIIAGTDTTAVTIAYLIWTVLKHPEVRARLQEEVESLVGEFSVADIQKLSYLQLVINESLRLYGSVSGSLPRAIPKGGSQIGGYFIPEGTTVTAQSFTLHRNPDIFKEPLK